MIYEVGSGTGIFCIEGFGARVYFIARPEPMLVDTGAPGHAENVIRELAAIGVQPIHLKKIILTHHHPGHVGGLALIKQCSGAVVLAHSADVSYISGRMKRRPPRNPAERVFQSAIARARFMEVAPTPVDRRIDEDDVVNGWRVLHTPGHTAGHISLLKGEILIAGDLLQAAGRGFRENPPSCTADLAASRASIAKVASLEFEAILLGHNPPFVFGAGEKVRELAATLS